MGHEEPCIPGNIIYRFECLEFIGIRINQGLLNVAESFGLLTGCGIDSVFLIDYGLNQLPDLKFLL